MALPPWFKLTRNAKRALPLINAGARRGLTPRQIERTVIDAGLPIDLDTDIIPLAAQIQEQIDFGKALQSLDKNVGIDLNRMPSAIGRLRKRNSFIVNIVGTDDAGNLINRHVTVSTDSPSITVKQIEDIAEQAVSEEGTSDTLNDVTASIVEGQSRLVL